MKPLILIVEDEPSIAENIRYALSTEGFNTIWHASGNNVIECLVQEAVDLIVLDIGLPDVNGLELCKAVREVSQVPVIFLTARSEEIDRVVGLEIGADDYIVKPFSPRELSARIRAVLRRSDTWGGAPPPTENPAVFTVNPDKRKITYFSTPLDLSRYEYDLLKLFIRRPGHIFSREKLMEMIWDTPEMSTDRTIDVHIKNIRNKLKKINPDIDPIQTHRSIGYSLKETL